MKVLWSLWSRVQAASGRWLPQGFLNNGTSRSRMQSFSRYFQKFIQFSNDTSDSGRSFLLCGFPFRGDRVLGFGFRG